jgi:hypothetical protein
VGQKVKLDIHLELERRRVTDGEESDMTVTGREEGGERMARGFRIPTPPPTDEPQNLQPILCIDVQLLELRIG